MYKHILYNSICLFCPFNCFMEVTMEKLIDVASYIVNRYQEEYKEKIDEMKLHKLLYFAQRESYIMNNSPLFQEQFLGWKYGPVLRDVRDMYRDNSFKRVVPNDCVERIKPIIDEVFNRYADRDSWSLSGLTHGELSWMNARKGIPVGENGYNKIENSDIQLDAQRIKKRRETIKATLIAKRQ